VPKGIDKLDWEAVHELACDVASAAMEDDEGLLAAMNAAMIDLLSKLNAKYGDHPAILATMADYLDDTNDRRAWYLKALAIAKEQGDQAEIDEIEDSLRTLAE
jgi:hypothetical protein